MLLRKVDAIVVLVSNMKHSIDFYKNTLGLPLRTRTTDWAEFFSEGTKLALHPIKKNLKQKAEPRAGMLVGFMVASMDDIYRALKKKKVKFLKEPREENFGRHTIIVDPDGYMISIVQLRLGPAEEIDLFGVLGVE